MPVRRAEIVLPKEQQDSAPLPVDAHARLHAMFDAHHNVVWRTLRRYGLDAESAADVAQQAYLVAIERVDDIHAGSERAFLMGTALRLARSASRRAARLVLDDRLQAQLRQAGHPEAHASTVQLLDLVLAQLDPSLIEVFALFDVEGFSAREVGETLGIPIGTAASRLRRAREEFRAVTARLSHVIDREGGGR
jgi:RNA polymerase sigma-70 factor (ECF subfamily)